MENINRNKKVSIVLPTYNEKEMVTLMHSKLKGVLDRIDMDYEIIFVDDNSLDGTIEPIKKLREKDKNVKYILMSRRFGDQVCLKAGIDYASGDVVITMDSDLQHPPEYIPRMIDKWKEGFDIIVMIREKEGHKDLLKKWAEIAFYKLISKLSYAPIYYRFAGFVLLNKKVVNALRKYKEKDPFIRGLIGLVGFRSFEMHYKEAERPRGASKYNLYNQFRLAIKGIISFSSKPLYVTFYVGIVTIFLSFIFAIKVLYEKLFLGFEAPGFTTIIIAIILLSGVQLTSIGILGIYMSETFMQTKGRPNYLIADIEGLTKSEK